MKVIDVKGDGNCLLHAVSYMLNGEEDIDLNLRKGLNDYFISNTNEPFSLYKEYQQQFFDSHSLEVNIDEQLSEEWQEIMKNVQPTAKKGPYGWLEPIHVFGLANYIKQPIAVFSAEYAYDGSQKSAFEGLYLPFFQQEFQRILNLHSL